VGNAERQRLGDCRVREQHFVDFTRPDFFAATVDEFLQAAGERQIAVGVKKPLIARTEQPLVNDFAVASGLFSYSDTTFGPFDRHLAALASGQLVAGIIQ